MEEIKKCTECKKVLNEGDIPREEGYCNGCYKTLWAEEFNSRNDVR